MAKINVSLSMAYERSFSIQKLHSLSEQVALHLCKLITMPRHASSGHWRRELATWLRSAYLLGSLKKGKRLKVDDYLYSLFAPCSSVQSWFVNDIAPSYKSAILPKDAQDQLDSFVKEAANLLASSKDDTSWVTLLENHFSSKSN